MSVQMNLPDLPEVNILELSNILNKWKLEFLLPKLIAEKIDLEVLEIIDVSQIHLLLRNYPIGVQVRFLHNLNVWRKNLLKPLKDTIILDEMLVINNKKDFYDVDEMSRTNSHKELYAASQASTAVCSAGGNGKESHRNTRKNSVICKTSMPLLKEKQKFVKNKSTQIQPFKIDLKNMLINSPPNGPDLIDLYEKQQHFTKHDRQRLLSTIVNYFLECKIPINLQLSYELENAIVQMFPSETLQKYRSSRYGKLYLLYLREKTEQVDSEAYSDKETEADNQEENKNDNQGKVNDYDELGNNEKDYDDYDDDDDILDVDAVDADVNDFFDYDSDNLYNSLMCDLYDKENAIEPTGAGDLQHNILIQTIYELHKKFVKIAPSFAYSEFLISARSTFNINNIEDYSLYYKDLKIDDLNFKSIILENYKSITFAVELKHRGKTKEDVAKSTTSLPDASFMRKISNLLPYVRLSDEGKPLQNSHRTIIAKTIVDECLRDNPERVLKRNDFLTLADNICKAFHTEVPSTYFVACRDSQPARGKLMNAYNNKRYTLSALGRLERRPLGLSKKRKRYTSFNENKESSKKYCLEESQEFSIDSILDMENLLQKWKNTHDLRQKELADGLKPGDYLNKYGILKTGRGIHLIEIDMKLLHPTVGDIDNWLSMYEMVVDKVRNIKKFQQVQRAIEAIDASKDIRYRAAMALNLLVYIFPYTWRFSKSEVQERFIKEYKSMEDLLSDSEPIDLQIRFVHQSQQIVYADFCICGFIFKCEDLLVALKLLFYHITALKLSYPRMCLRIWQFVQLAIFNLDIDEAILPQIECTINDLLYIRERKN